MRRNAAALILALGLAGVLPAARAEEPKPAKDVRAEIRTRVDEMVRCLQALRMGGSTPRDVPGFTEQANALLALPAGDLQAVLSEMVRKKEGEEEGGWSGSPAGPVAALLLGIGPTANRRFEGQQFTEVHGFALVAWIGEEFGYNQHTVLPDPPELPLVPGATFRRPFRPRPFDLLKEILASTDRVREAGGRIMGGDFLRSAGMELGDAARRDPEFAKYLLAVSVEPREDKVAETILTAALGRWAGPGAVEELKRRLARAVKTEDMSEWHEKVTAVAKALTEAGAEAALAELAVKGEGGDTEEKKARFAGLVGGDAVAGAFLEKVRADPTPENLGRLANALNDPMNPKESVELRMKAFEEASRLQKASKDPAVRGWSFALMQTSLWPGLYWRFGFMQGKNFPPDADREAPLPSGQKCEEERDYFLGAWPDARVQYEALKAALAAGRVKVDTRWSRDSGVKSGVKEIEFRGDRAPGKPAGVEATGRRSGPNVVVSVKNTGKESFAVNPVAASFAVAIMVPLKGEPKGRVELDLQVGRVLGGYRLLVPASSLKVVKPGESHDIVFAVGESLPAGSRVLFSWRDEFDVEGACEHPLLKTIWDLRIE